jgi:hypothetical protein
MAKKNAKRQAQSSQAGRSDPTLVVHTRVGTAIDAREAPSAKLAKEGRELGSLEVVGHDFTLKASRIHDSERSSACGPMRYITEFRHRQNPHELQRKRLHVRDVVFHRWRLSGIWFRRAVEVLVVPCFVRGRRGFCHAATTMTPRLLHEIVTTKESELASNVSIDNIQKNRTDIIVQSSCIPVSEATSGVPMPVCVGMKVNDSENSFSGNLCSPLCISPGCCMVSLYWKE